MIKGLGSHLKARKEQQRLYWTHLKDQYSDRLEYYRTRALSRLKGSNEITLIQDGMDQNKVTIPRHPCLFGKDFPTFQKPKCHISLTLVHGYFNLWVVSNPDTPKDSNSSVECLAHTLNILSKEHNVNLRGHHINIQSDNTPREIKNNHSMRWLICQVSCSNIKSASLRYLRTGHSHEDVDQCFGRLAKHLARVRNIETPQDFVRIVKSFADNMRRPHESASYVVSMNSTRDWRFGMIIARSAYEFSFDFDY